MERVRSFDRNSAVRAMAILLCLQGAASVGAVDWSPRFESLHSVESGLLFLVAVAACAAAIALAPALLALLHPESRATRAAIGLSQALMTLLLFYLGGAHLGTWAGLLASLMLLGITVDWVVMLFVIRPCVAITHEVTAAPPALTAPSQAQDRQTILAEKLRHAIQHGGLSLDYQPIFSEDERMIAVEALARLHDVDEGIISPVEFIPVSESTGLIVPLTEWVLREACRQMARWTAIDPSLQRLAVNVSVLHIGRADFIPTVKNILAETGLSPEHLELEITESALASDFETVKHHLAHLRLLGIRVAIDDFGIGYSSLSRVRELDADTLKVDRQFLRNATETPTGIAIVQAIIDMAHSMDLSVTAEGVETIDQMDMLRTMRCDSMQGFLLGRPQSPETITASLQEIAGERRANRPHLVAAAR